MQKTGCGAFCQSCQKEVIDFTAKSEAEIISFLSQPRGKVCGRFNSDMLNRQLKAETNGTGLSWKKWAAAATVLLGINLAKANTVNIDKPATVQVDTTQKGTKVVTAADSANAARLPLGNEAPIIIVGGNVVRIDRSPRAKMRAFFRKVKYAFRRKKHVTMGRF